MRLAIIGDPVSHSRSPELQRGFLERAGLHGSYDAIRVPAGDGAVTIGRLRDAGYIGLNVTTPLKEEAFERADYHDVAALAAGSVNTLVLEAAIGGYNTDGVGTVGVLRDAGLRDLSNAKVLVLGAGPTARSSVVALREAGANVWIWNRTAQKARTIALRLDALTFDGAIACDAVFATLPPGAIPENPDVIRAAVAAPILIDANYGERATLATALGRSGLDGSGMLEHSARASFEIWRRVAAGGVTS